MARLVFTNPVRGNRGSALTLAAGAAFVLATLTVALLSITGTSLRANNRLQIRSTALHAAESGAEEAVLWLRDQSIPPSVDQNLSATLGAARPDGTTWTVWLYCEANNPNVFLKTYRILSTGTCNGVSRTVEIVVKQATFGKYAYFTDKETSSGGGAIWWNSSDKIDGPVHSNNSNGTNFNIDYSAWANNNPRRPIFLDQVTAAGSTINYTPSRPTNETTFQKVFLNGSNGYTLGVPRINLPPSTDTQKAAAWGSGSGYPSGTSGVYLKTGTSGTTGGGIFIQGDCTITLSVDASNNQIVTIKQGSNTTVVTLNINNNTSSVTGPVGNGSPTSANSIGNGVIYCTGNITGLSGTIADNKVVNGEIARASAWTIATDTNASKDITITGDLVYKTRPDKTQPASAACNLSAGTLGLVGQDIKIADAGVASPNNHPNREIDAVMLAGSASVNGSISVNNYNDNKGTGTLKVIGGLIQSTRGIVASLSGGVVQSGYAKNYIYDPRLANTPPPFYPTTGCYDRLSWKVLPDH